MHNPEIFEKWTFVKLVDMVSFPNSLISFKVKKNDKICVHLAYARRENITYYYLFITVLQQRVDELSSDVALTSSGLVKAEPHLKKAWLVPVDYLLLLWNPVKKAYLLNTSTSSTKISTLENKLENDWRCGLEQETLTLKLSNYWCLLNPKWIFLALLF